MKEKIIWGLILILLLSLPHSTLANAYNLPNNSPCNPDLGTISSISTNSFSPNATVQLQGTGFGARDLTDDFPESILLFDENGGSLEVSTNKISAWTDSLISFSVPAELQFNAGYLAIKISTPENQYQYICSTDNIESSAWSLISEESIGTPETPEAPEIPVSSNPIITSLSPELIYTNVKVTINGENFGSADEYWCDKCKILVGDNTVYPSQDANYHYEWSDTSISFIVPWYLLGESVDSIKIINTEGIESNSFPFTLSPHPDDPLIESISPDILVPGETIVTITGKKFGEVPDYQNRVCFGQYPCVYSFDPAENFIKWSDNEIQVKTPYDIAPGQNNISINAYHQSQQYFYTLIGPSYTAKTIPKVTWFYYSMDQYETYEWKGSGFGSSPGKAVLNGTPLELSSWSDTNISFKIPPTASSGEFYIENADGFKSQKFQVTVNIVKKYSEDEFSKYQYYIEQLALDKAWQITQGSPDVVVAVIDSGVDINHLDLKSSIWVNQNEVPSNNTDDDSNGYVDDYKGWDFSTNSNSTIINNGHGTMVASVIGATKDNGTGIAGVAPGVKIMPLNIVEESNWTYMDLDAANEAIKYAVDNGADIINLSFGGYNSAMFYEESLKYAYQNNVLVVAAAHNHNKNLDITPIAPACVDLNYNAVIGVASVNSQNIKSSFSNYGEACVDIAAPGENILVAVAGSTDDYISSQGTSFSAPMISGIAALVKSYHPDWNVEEIKKVIFDSSSDIDSLNPNYTNKLGSGVPNAYVALTAARPSVVYNKFDPDTELVIKNTGLSVKLDEPKTNPIPEPAPIKNEEIKEEVLELNSADEEEIIKESFPDVVGHKNEIAISYLKDTGVINGYPDGTFKPDIDVNRAELLKIIIEGMDLTPSASEYNNCFSDVKDEWFAPYVCYAKSLGWIQGYSDGTFKPGQTVNKVESIKMLLNSQSISVPSAIYIKPFEDVNVQEWFAPFVSKAKQLEILEEEGDMFNPADGMKRAGISENLYRLLTLSSPT